MAFNLKDGESLRTRFCEKASATVIAARSLVTLDAAGLIIPAVAASTAVAWCPNGAPSGETEVGVTTGTDFTLTGTADANFAEANRGAEVDITDAQLIDLGASATDVLRVSITNDAGTVGSTADVEVRINKPLF